MIYKIILGAKNKAELGHLGTSIYSTSLENDFSIKQKLFDTSKSQKYFKTNQKVKIYKNILRIKKQVNK